VITINLEFIYNGSLVELDIKRHNSLLIINQEKYIYLYYLFYNSIKRKDNNCNIKINKEEISSKKYTFIDLTSPIAIVNELENKKDTLLFSYTSHIFDKLVDNYLDRLLEIYEKVMHEFNEINDLLNCNIKDDVVKNFVSNYEIKFNILEYEKILKNLLKIFLDSNIDKKIIIFYNSKYLKYNFENNKNVIAFDTNDKLEVNKYNILISNEYMNINYEIIIKYITEKSPIILEKSLVESILTEYLTNIIYKKEINEVIEYKNIIYKILSKKLNINHNFNNKLSKMLESYIATL
jgi:hypothetical protein